MTSRAVHWHEGMFLRPHHFQASHRFLSDLGKRNHKWDNHYNWGLRSIDLDREALANHRLVVHTLEARLRDGTTVAVPGDCTLAPVDLRPVFQGKETRGIVVYVAVPALFLGRRNLSPERDADYRYYQETVNPDDENTGGNPQTVPVRIQNARLLVGPQDQTGYEVMPIARLEKSGQADGGPQLDESFVPPLLSCDAWPPFADGVLRAVQDRLDKKIDWLVQRIGEQGITFDRQAPGDALVLKQLQQLNEASSVLGVLLAAPGVHPLAAFLELSRVIGKLAIFGAGRKPPDLPHYNHDDLGGCFGSLKHHLDAQLDIVVEPEYKERPFVGAGWRMQVTLEPAWLAPGTQLFIGVQSSVEEKQCVDLLTRRGFLDMKVGSSDRVDEVYRQGSEGLRIAPVQPAPAALPRIAGQVFLQVNADPKNPEWPHVRNSLTLALRLNENMIVGNIQGQRRLTVKTTGKNVTMQFSLYVLPEKKS